MASSKHKSEERERIRFKPQVPRFTPSCFRTEANKRKQGHTDGLRETIDSTCKGHGKELAEEVGMVVHTADWTVLCEWLDGFGELAHAADQITERATA
ncbi:uncharacterized [Tachysurus ichikawai]